MQKQYNSCGARARKRPDLNSPHTTPVLSLCEANMFAIVGPRTVVESRVSRATVAGQS